jgi:hypothetical protein
VPIPILPWVFVVALLGAAWGCGNPAEVAKPRLVTLAELEAEASNLDRISYLGTDKQFHYFKTNAGRYYKVELAQWEPADRDQIYEIAGEGALPGPNQPGFELYVSVRNGIVVLSPLP